MASSDLFLTVDVDFGCVGVEYQFSNIDWGQDLFRLRRWLDEHPEAASELKMAYFNRIDARIAGLEWEVPPHGVTETAPDDESAAGYGPQPGYYAISVRFVRGNQAGATDGRGGYRFAPFRAYEYFRHFEPIAKAGYSIFIYRITPEQANAVRTLYGLPPLPAEDQSITANDRDRQDALMPEHQGSL